jgi:hypothetical protein
VPDCSEQIAPNGSNFIYTSNNSGATWNMARAPVTNLACIASSADGNKLVALVNSANIGAGIGGPIFTTTNSGATWAQAGALAALSAGSPWLPRRMERNWRRWTLTIFFPQPIRE